MTQTTNTDQRDPMYLPWPHDVAEPYVGIASDDPAYTEAVEWANKTHSAYQVKIHAQLQRIRQSFDGTSSH